jgi:hypothetical protein
VGRNDQGTENEGCLFIIGIVAMLLIILLLVIVEKH